MASSKPERPRLDTTTPNMGRVADYFLGGKDNFAADREAAKAAMAITPELPVLWREGRRFLGRAVRFLAQEAGIRQFIDVGCGLPTQGNVHEIAHAVAPDARVVYVDNDPMVVVHGQALLQDDRLTVVVEADLRDPEALLADPGLTKMINPEEPVAILLFGVLQDIQDDSQVDQIIDYLRKTISPGSYLAISHPVGDLRPEATAKLAAFYQNEGAVTGPHRKGLRSKAEIERYFDGLALVDPGVVYIPEWRPEDDLIHRPDSIWVVGGIGHKE